MIGWLLWKNYKQQFQRRKMSWIIKMMLPIIFTLVLGALRTAFTTTKVNTDYGDNYSSSFSLSSVCSLLGVDYSWCDLRLHIDYEINQPYALSPITTQPDVIINLPLCETNWTGPAPFISIVPPYGTDPQIDAVLDIMKAK